jgi:hypothetical protein
MTASHEYTPPPAPAIFRRSPLIAGGDCPCCGTAMTEPLSQPSPGMPATYRTRAHIHPAGSPLRNDADWFVACARCNADQGHLSLSEWAAVLTMRADERAARVKALVSKLGDAGASVTRRAALGVAGKAAVALLAGGGMSVAGDMPDAALRALWQEYQALDAEATTAWEAFKQSRDALERRVLGGKTIEELHYELSDEQDDAVHREIFDNDERDRTTYDFAGKCAERLRGCIDRIRATPPEGMIGLAIKLIALPHQWQGEDVEENVLYVLEDVNGLHGTALTLGGQSLADHLAWLATLERKDGEADHA